MLANLPPDKRAVMEARMAQMRQKAAHTEFTFSDAGRGDHAGQYSCRVWQEQRRRQAVRRILRGARLEPARGRRTRRGDEEGHRDRRAAGRGRARSWRSRPSTSRGSASWAASRRAGTSYRARGGAHAQLRPGAVPAGGQVRHPAGLYREGPGRAGATEGHAPRARRGRGSRWGRSPARSRSRPPTSSRCRGSSSPAPSSPRS